MEPRSRLSFTPAFKAEIVELCRRGDRSAGKAARDYDLTETAARMGVSGRAEVDANTRGGQPSDEPELAALERESRRLRDVELPTGGVGTLFQHRGHYCRGGSVVVC